MKGLYLIYLLSSIVCLNKGKSSEQGSTHLFSPKGGVIPWCENRPLTWSDFTYTEKIFSKNDIIAISSIKIDYTKRILRGKVHRSVVAYFIKKNSRVIKGKDEPEGLRHEQTHFDIAEVTARGIRREFEILDRENAPETSYRRIYSKYIREHHKNQRRYDIKTDYNRDRNSQVVWNDKIMIELKSLDSWQMTDSIICP